MKFLKKIVYEKNEFPGKFPKSFFFKYINEIIHRFKYKQAKNKQTNKK